MIDEQALTRPLKYCKQSGCPEKTRNDNGYCDSHKVNNAQTARLVQWRENNPAYSTARWQTFRRMIITANFQCQRLRAGVQCERPARLVHHLVSPQEREDLMFAPSNVVALCTSGCHPNTPGTPDWKVGRDYVKTEFVLTKF